MVEGKCTPLFRKHILVCANKIDELHPNLIREFEFVKDNFCGVVFTDMKEFNSKVVPNTIIYFCGNIKSTTLLDPIKNENILIIKEYSQYDDRESTKNKLISIGQVPLNIHNMGVFFKTFFDVNKDYFTQLNLDHKFQTLTESNKESNAFRTGIYLTKVQETEDNQLKFKLLRCSSNLNGPTDNFRSTDDEIVTQINEVRKYFFDTSAELNHVLAQVYHNKIHEAGNNKQKQKKAKIAAHSDKTKDMPQDGVIVFCTFYNFENKEIEQNEEKNNKISPFTKLRFKLKSIVVDRQPSDSKLTKCFDVILYPNSVFMIPLSTNRLYTHEIIPSAETIDKIPTRMGYVIRSSKTDAIFHSDQTFISVDNTFIPMKEPDEEGVKQLKELYYKENRTDEVIQYDKFYFSMNKGDYMKPIL